jgi:hypothetical protein
MEQEALDLDFEPIHRCSRCGEFKPASLFNWRRKDKGWKDTYCKPCRAAYKKEHYAKNKQRYLDQNKARSQRVIRRRMAFLISLLRVLPCVDCGETDVLVLEFDHLGDKSFDIAYGIRFAKWEPLLNEIAKCEVVCANCHRRRTARRGGFRRTLYGSPNT